MQDSAQKAAAIMLKIVHTMLITDLIVSFFIVERFKLNIIDLTRLAENVQAFLSFVLLWFVENASQLTEHPT